MSWECRLRADGQLEVSNGPGWQGWRFTVKLRSYPKQERRLPDPVGLAIAAPEGATLNANTFRRVPVGTVLRLAVEFHRAPLVALVGATVGQPERRPYGGSGQHTAAVVALYRTALSQGLNNPREVIAEHFSVSTKTVSRWLSDARASGALGTYTDERKAAHSEHQPQD